MNRLYSCALLPASRHDRYPGFGQSTWPWQPPFAFCGRRMSLTWKLEHALEFSDRPKAAEPVVRLQHSFDSTIWAPVGSSGSQCGHRERNGFGWPSSCKSQVAGPDLLHISTANYNVPCSPMGAPQNVTVTTYGNCRTPTDRTRFTIFLVSHCPSLLPATCSERLNCRSLERVATA